MRVLESHPHQALCEASDGHRRMVDTAMVGQVPAGAWLLVFLGSAREQIDPDQAETLNKALEALSAVMAGQTDVDHLFPDLAGREPPLPAHLRPLVDKPTPRK